MVAIHAAQFGNANANLPCLGDDGIDAGHLAQRFGSQLIEEVVQRVGDGAEAVGQFGGHLVDLGQGVQRRHAPVEAQAKLCVRHVVGRDVGCQRQVDEHVLRLFGGWGVAAQLGLAPLDGSRQQPRVHVEADGRDVAALLAAQEVARPANLHVAHGNEVAGAELGVLGDGLQSRLGVGCQAAPRGVEEVGVGAAGAAADPPPQLVELRQTELLRPVDDEGVGVGEVQPTFDDGRAEQNVHPRLGELDHDLLQLALAHLAVGDDNARLRHQLLQSFADDIDALHAVVDEEHLAAAVQFAQDGRADARIIRLADPRFHRQALGGRGVDDADVAHAGQRHVQRARNGRRRQRQHVHFGAPLLQLLLVGHAEALLLVDDDQPQVFEGDVVR